MITKCGLLNEFKILFRIMVLLVLAVIIMLLLSWIVIGSPVGCEPYNSDVLKCWNNGSIENTSYFSIDGLQMANKIDRFSWTTYDYGLRFNNNFYPIGRLNPAFLGMRSDNQTYYELVWSYHYSLGQRRAWVNYTLSQNLNDDYVNATFSFYPYAGRWRNLNQPVYIYRSMTNIDVWNDGGTDVINYVNGSGVQGFDLNVSVNEWLPSMLDYLIVGQINKTGSIRWLYGGQSDGFLKNNYPGNADVFWWRHFTDNVMEGRIYSITDWWIDADPCTKSCQRGISYAYQRFYCENNASYIRCNAGEDLNSLLKMYIKFNALMGSGTCSYSAGCLINVSRDYGAFNFVEIPYKTSTTEPGLVCDSRSRGSCQQDNIAPASGFGVTYSYSRLFNVTCRKSGVFVLDSYFEYELSHAQWYMNVTCPPDTASPNVVLISPDAGATTQNTTVYLSCSASDTYPLLNLSLWHNFSGGYVMEAINSGIFPLNAAGLSSIVNVTPGVYGWYCAACDNNDNCKASAKRVLITINAPIIILPSNQPTPAYMYNTEQKCNFVCWLTKLFSRRNK